MACCVLSLSVCGVLQAADPKVECYDFDSRMIYHSPETPGYTSWVGFAKTPDNKLLLSFAQQTGKAPEVKSESVVLESGDVPAATAILDRFLHHAEIVAITGKSYRLKDQACKQTKGKV